MILDETKVSELLGNNKEEDKMETDYKSHNVNVLPASPYGNNGGFGNNGSFWEALIAWGLIDRNRNTTGEVATATQVESLANSFGTTASEMSSRLNALQISTCEQTSTLKDAIHNSSTTNLVGQNALGEKITNVAYKGDSNAKDLQNTILLDGGTTRKNDDDNTTDLKNNQYAGFSNTKDSIYALSTKTSAEHCDIKGLILDNKYEGKSELCATQNFLSTQATTYHNSTMMELQRMESNNALRAKDEVLREKDDQISAMRYNDLKQEIKESKNCHGQMGGASVEILSENFSKNIGSAIGNSINARFDRFEDSVDRKLFAIGNTVSIGRNNKTES